MSTRHPPVGIDHVTVVPGNGEERRPSREPDREARAENPADERFPSER